VIEDARNGSAGVTRASWPHRRYDPLLDRWVLVSVGRTSRPWHGTRESAARADAPRYDPTCYLCPGNVRANGERNPDYPATFVFTNDFAALQPDGPEDAHEDGLLRWEGERGTSRVVCFSPRHDLGLGSMEPGDVRGVIDLWADQTTELGEQYRWVQVFENRGTEMGASNPHPHGQIWAGSALPTDAAREDANQRAHHAASGRSLLVEYAAQELGGPRVVEARPDWLVVVPFWAAWPFETLLIAKRGTARLTDLDAAARDDLARVIRTQIGAYDALFGMEFPYSMGWHQAPFADPDAADLDAWQLHAHFYPPLLRANARKFMVGYELLAEVQRDLAPEEAAQRLRDVLVATAG
jgi:UDPglucose--hexose-1-phosphate uridylyltransferase